MKRNALLFCVLFLSGPLQAQSGNEAASCLRACLQAPEMEVAFTQEWGALRPLYLRKRETPGIGKRPVDDQIGQLAAADFQGLPWEVIPLADEEIRQLPAEEVEFGILEADIGFRAERATVNFFINLPRYPRRWMACSFLLENKGGQWAVLEKSIEVLP